jgi:hypothetical protein
LGERGWDQGQKKERGVREGGGKSWEKRMSDERRKRRSERRTGKDEKPDIDGASHRER